MKNILEPNWIKKLKFKNEFHFIKSNIIQPNGQSDAPKSFTFDGAFGIDSNTSQIYDDITYDLVEGVIGMGPKHFLIKA